ncbi:hypothetical protein CYMTET_16873 [Cymbomonas tetramitiformis]|uniref:Marginal zone B-and B1-cell-specific protein n=1 Tax=Cymbomonas tetramitiformis TaxID=36881 RepID=A0AAE0GBM7_9CHLO|nr:hypothetical protein CYMTET_16873 [Cymbomonas tetramitiformis]
MFSSTYLSLLLCVTNAVVGEGSAKEGQPVSVGIPKLSDEEHISLGVPLEQRCRACQAVTFQLRQSLGRQRQRKGDKPLSETIYLETMEQVCKGTEKWDQYGYQEFAGGNILQGPGILKQQCYGGGVR